MWSSMSGRERDALPGRAGRARAVPAPGWAVAGAGTASGRGSGGVRGRRTGMAGTRAADVVERGAVGRRRLVGKRGADVGVIHAADPGADLRQRQVLVLEPADQADALQEVVP